MSTPIAVVIILVGYSIVTSGCPIPGSLNGSCCDIQSDGFQFSISTKSRVYNISNFCGDCEHWAYGYCDAVSDGGGWLVIQRRIQKYAINFHRNWYAYENGFGDLNKEFWYGLRPIHCLTNIGKWELRIDFTFSNGTKSYMQYKQFRIGPADSQYRFSISGFVGITPTDPFTTYNIIIGQPFSTVDRLNYGSCAQHAHGSNSPGGWWYYTCFHINLNYNYDYSGSQGFVYLGSKWLTPSFIEMKIRPTTCNA